MGLHLKHHKVNIGLLVTVIKWYLSNLIFNLGNIFAPYCMNLSLDLCHRYWRGRRFNPIKASIKKNVKIKASPPKKQQTKNNKKYEMIWLHLCGGYRRRGGECIGCKSLRLPEVAILAGASKHIRTKQRRGHFNCKQHIVQKSYFILAGFREKLEKESTYLR